jgi:hypothetical protein
MDAPRMTKSMASALQDLELEHRRVIYPGDHEYPVHVRDAVVSLLVAVERKWT